MRGNSVRGIEERRPNGGDRQQSTVPMGEVVKGKGGKGKGKGRTL